MGIDIRLPNIPNGAGVAEKVNYIQNWLFQLVPQLNWAIGVLDNEQVRINKTINVVSPSSPTATESKNAQSTFDSIKGLIIKSADIVNAYYESINHKFSGLYVAESDFGTYKEITDHSIDVNSSAITQNLTRIESVESDITTIYTSLGYIKTGELEVVDGKAIYGIEVGQTNIEDDTTTFRRFARFTSNRLSFFDNNGTEVAYVSNYKLYITDVEILGNATFGNFKLYTSGGLRLKWNGGE